MLKIDIFIEIKYNKSSLLGEFMRLERFLEGMQEEYNLQAKYKAYCIRSTREEFNDIKNYLTRLYYTDETMRDLVDEDNICEIYNYLDCQDENYYNKYGVYFDYFFEFYEVGDFNRVYSLMGEYQEYLEKFNPLRIDSYYTKNFNDSRSNRLRFPADIEEDNKKYNEDVMKFFNRRNIVKEFYHDVSQGNFGKLWKMLEDYKMLKKSMPWVADYAISRGAISELHHLYMPKEEKQK